MKKLSFIIIFLALAFFYAKSQSITLFECYAKTEQNYPLIQQTEIIALSKQYTLENASRIWIPQLELSGSATYQSESTEISLTDPFNINVAVLPKDQYQVALQLNQTIWDGGEIHAAKEQITANANIQQKQNEIDIYALRARINDLFFGILLFDSQIKQLRVNITELDRNYEQVESYVTSGIANTADLDIITVEKLATEQRIIQLTTLKSSYLKVLSTFVGTPLAETTALEKPSIVAVSDSNHRLELELFDANIALQNAQRSKILAKNMPRIGFFAKAGYGQPGLNMFQQGFSPYAMAGIQLQWKFGNLYTIGNDKKLIENSINGIKVQRAVFLLNQNIQAEQLKGVAEQYRLILEKDQDIITLRENIYQNSSVKAELGTISTHDLMRDQNLNFMAKSQKNVHEIEYLKAIYDIKNLYNN